MIISYCVGLFFLASVAAEDIRKKEISIYKVVFFTGLFLLYQILSGPFPWKEILCRLVPGIFFLLLAFCTRESIGYGDGVVIMVLGLWTGGWFVLAVVGIGIVLAGVYGAFRLMRGRRDPIPFIPFLLLGMEAALYYA